MEKYIINNKTIALLKKNNKTIIINVDKVEVINKSINKILEYSCNYYGSTLKGRIESAKKILNVEYKLPIIIDDMNNLVLISCSSSRNNCNLYIVTNKIINYELQSNQLIIYCVNNVKFKISKSINIFEKMLLKSFRLNNILNWRKNTNFL